MDEVPERVTVPVPPDPSGANDPASFPALAGTPIATLPSRLLARGADIAVLFCWWALAVSGGGGAAAAAVAFAASMALLLIRAQSPGEALLGLVALDVQTGRPSGGAAFVKILLQVVLVVATAGLGVLALAATTRGPLRRNLADRATGVVVASLRADADSAQEGGPTGWASAVRSARWEGDALEQSAERSECPVLALLQVTDAGVKVRAEDAPVLIIGRDGSRTRLTRGDGALAGEGAAIRTAQVTLHVSRS